MASSLPPGFQGIDFSQWPSWPAVVIDGLQYKQIPGNSQYVFDPYDGTNGSIKVNPKPVKDAIEAETPKQDNSTVAQIAPTAGLIGGVYLGKKYLWPDGTTQNVPPPNTGTPPVPAGGGNAGILSGATPSPGLTIEPTNPGQFQTPMSASQSQGLQNAPQPQQLPEGATPQPDGTVTDAAGNNIGSWAQGVGGAILFYQGYKQFQDGDKFGGGLGMAAGASYGASAAGIGGSTVASAAPIIGGAYGAYTLGNMAMNSGEMHKSDTAGATMSGASSGAALGAGIGSVVPGVGTAIGAGVGAVVGGLYGLGAGLSASGKGERQQVRDKWRDNVIKNNVPLFDPKTYKGDNADGSTYDFGKDKFGFGTGEGDFDLSNPTTAKAAAYGNILGAMQGASGKGREAIATQFLGASTSNAQGDLNKVKANYAHYLNKFGIKDVTQAQAALDQARPTMSDQEYQVFSNDLKELYAPVAPNNTSQGAGILTINGPKVEQPKTSGWVIRNGKAVRK